MFSDFIDKLVGEGKCSFTLKEAQMRLGKTANSIKLSISHCKAKGQIISPARGFYIIIPSEYRKIGCIPPEQFIPYLMEHFGYNYYAALLTAAAYHGAAHQAPQIFQVMINRKRPASLKCGKFDIQFIIKKEAMPAYTMQARATPKSYINISSPATTAFDLISYPKASGGLNHIATVLSELQEVIDAKEFAMVAYDFPNNACKQRLGYILEKVGANKLATVLAEDLAKQNRLQYVPLMAEKTSVSNGFSKNQRWKIIENTTIESDI